MDDILRTEDDVPTLHHCVKCFGQMCWMANQSLSLFAATVKFMSNKYLRERLMLSRISVGLRVASHWFRESF